MTELEVSSPAHASRTEAASCETCDLLPHALQERFDDLVAHVNAFARDHYREFDWRTTSDPYAIWISEVMLQQTQTKRVEERYREWLRRFPSVDELALASPADCLSAWQGMGYNRRALALLKTARLISDAGGVFPHTEQELRSLPGIGPATAAGICAFAFNQHCVYIETNVRAVFLHELFADQENLRDQDLAPFVARACPASAARTSRVPNTPRMWYYALLDYGNYLKKTLPNPSRRARAYRKQSPFEGSRRQKRAELVRLLLASDLADEAPDIACLAERLNACERAQNRPECDLSYVKELVDELAKEGFCRYEAGRVRIASN